MSICVAKSRYDTHVMSLSELARRLDLPISRMRKAVADGTVRVSGSVGHSTVVALTDDEIESLGAQLGLSAPAQAASRYANIGM